MTHRTIEQELSYRGCFGDSYMHDPKTCDHCVLLDLATQLAGLLREIDNWGSLPHAYRCNVTLQVGEPEHPPICDCDVKVIEAKMHALLDGEGGGDGHE